MEMLDYIKEGVRDWEDDEEICAFSKSLSSGRQGIAPDSYTVWAMLFIRCRIPGQ